MNRHARRKLPNKTLLPSVWRRFALSAHNPHSAILRQLNAIRVLFAGELVDIVMELRQHIPSLRMTKVNHMRGERALAS